LTLLADAKRITRGITRRFLVGCLSMEVKT